jgi:hypothetical protein
MNKIFVGYDSTQPESFDVCKHSLLPHSVTPLKLVDLPMYNRTDVNGSTEFSLTRFLVPYLSNYEGWSLFCDSDFLWLCDPLEVFDLCDDMYTVMVIKHEYSPKTDYKMNGKYQHKYPKKNWSSLMLFNNSKCTNLSPTSVNQSLPSYLHQFHWTNDECVGSLPTEYNWLVGYYSETETFKPKALHYTDSGPWHKHHTGSEYDTMWTSMYSEIHHNLAHATS